MGKRRTEKVRLSPYGHTLHEDDPRLPAFVDSSTGSPVSAAEIGNSNARIINLCNQLAASLLRVRAQILAKDKAIGVQILDAAGTLAQVGRRLKNSIDEMLELNTHLAGKPVCQRGDLVRYYKKS
jgi:hypothetical protein